MPSGISGIKTTHVAYEPPVSPKGPAIAAAQPDAPAIEQESAVFIAEPEASYHFSPDEPAQDGPGDEARFLELRAIASGIYQAPDIASRLPDDGQPYASRPLTLPSGMKMPEPPPGKCSPRALPSAIPRLLLEEQGAAGDFQLDRLAPPPPPVRHPSPGDFVWADWKDGK